MCVVHEREIVLDLDLTGLRYRYYKSGRGMLVSNFVHCFCRVGYSTEITQCIGRCKVENKAVVDVGV